MKCLNFAPSRKYTGNGKNPSGANASVAPSLLAPQLQLYPHAVGGLCGNTGNSPGPSGHSLKPEQLDHGADDQAHFKQPK